MQGAKNYTMCVGFFICKHIAGLLCSRWESFQITSNLVHTLTGPVTRQLDFIVDLCFYCKHPCT